MIALLPWLKSPNLWLAAAIVALCVGIYTAGQRSERNKNAAEMVAINTPIIEQRGKDEAEIAAKSLADEMGDKIVSGSLTQQCQLREDTAMLLESVR